MKRLAVVLFVAVFMVPVLAQAAPKTTGGPIAPSCDPCTLGGSVIITGEGYDPSGTYTFGATRPAGSVFNGGLYGVIDATGHLSFSIVNLTQTGSWRVGVYQVSGRSNMTTVAQTAFGVI